MTGKILSLSASDGYQLKMRHFPAAAGLPAAVVALHGIQSHSGWYHQSASGIADSGIHVYFADRRGSGLNQQDRGHADHGMRLVHDVRQTIRFVRRQHGAETRIVLLGLSWGGKIAAATAALTAGEIDGLALLYPGLTPRIQPTMLQRRQLQLARHFDVRHRPVPVPLSDPALFTDNHEARQFIRNDGDALHTVTTGFLNAGLDLDRILQQHKSNIQVPVLLMLAGRDKIIDNQRTRHCVSGFGTPHLSTIEFPAASHTLEFEIDCTNFLQLLIRWLHQCVEGSLNVRSEAQDASARQCDINNT
jgi:acylglycerol lipase